MTDKKPRIVTVDELFEEKRKELETWAESDEGKASMERALEKGRREEAARLKWEAENPPDYYAMGADACLSGDERLAPEGLSRTDATLWYDGYDSVEEDDDEY